MGTVRPASACDAAAIQAIYAPFVRQSAISFEDVPPDRRAIADRMACAPAGVPWLVAESDGQVVGYAYASAYRARPAYRFSAEVSVYVADGGRRQGAARALYGALFNRLTTAGTHAVLAGITLPNAASVGFHEAMGFRPVGVFREIGFKFDRWHDVGWWQRLLGEVSSPSGSGLSG